MDLMLGNFCVETSLDDSLDALLRRILKVPVFTTVDTGANPRTPRLGLEFGYPRISDLEANQIEVTDGYMVSKPESSYSPMSSGFSTHRPR
jgi:hypothetical protein